IRVDGQDSYLQGDVHWRWTPTAENRFQEWHARGDNVGELSTNALTLRPGDWTEFRGMLRDGVVRGEKIATDWKAKTPPALWRHPIGPAWSSVCVIDGRLFTQEQRGEMEAVVCYDAATGKELWAHEDDARFWESVSGAGPRSTPTFAVGRLYTLGAT